MLILFILIAIIIYKFGPIVYSAFGDTGVTVLLGAVGVLIVAFVIIKDCLKLSGGSNSAGSGKGFSVDELEFFDMMDED